MYDNMDNRKIDKIEDFFDKNTDTLKGILIQLEYKWKRKCRYFLIKLKFFV